MAEDETKTFTQDDIDNAVAQVTAKHQEEMNALAGKMRAEFKAKEQKAKEDAEKLAKQANMTELEKAKEDYKELESKYQQSQDTIALTTQKDETRKYLKEIGVDESNLDYVFIPKDIDGTKAKAKAFKEMIENVKKSVFETNAKTNIPNASKDKISVDEAQLRKAMGLKN